MCFVLCGPQGPQNVGSVARVMQNFGVYDLRIVNPGKFVLEGGDQEDGEGEGDDDDGASFRADGANSRGGVNSGAKLGPDGLGTDLPPALQPTLKSDGGGDASSSANADDADDSSDADAAAADVAPPLCEEAYRFACAADWLLADAERCDTTLEALDDCTFVMATTARPRGNMPLVTARVAAEMLAKEAKRGKVAVLFGNERTGLTNEELAQAHAAVAIPTAGQGTLCRKSLKYTGGTGPTSLNLSQAVGVLAYELFMAADAVAAEEAAAAGGGGGGSGGNARSANAGKIDLPASQLMTVGEKNMLMNELLGARRALDVLPGEATLDDDEEDAEEEEGVEKKKKAEEGAATEADDDLDGREERGIERVLNSAPLARRDAAALFQLARRVKAMAGTGTGAGEAGDSNRSGGGGGGGGLLDRVVVTAAAELVDAAAAAGKSPPTVRQARAHFRNGLGLSLTNREISRALRRAGQDRAETTPR